MENAAAVVSASKPCLLPDIMFRAYHDFRTIARRLYLSLPLPMPIRYWIKFLRCHRRPLIPWSNAFTDKLVCYIHGDYVASLQHYVDKIAVRSFVAERVGIGYLTRVYAVAERFEDLDLDLLPDRFYLKANHGCRYNMPVPAKSALDLETCTRNFRDFLSTDYSRKGERQYQNIPRRVFAEEFLDTSRSNRVMLRMFSFDGTVEFIVVQSFDVPPIASYYLPDWTPAPFMVGVRRHHDWPRPANLKEAIDVAARLSEGFPFVRVDLYWLAGRTVFSELTFSPGNGLRRIRPREADLALGRKLSWDDRRR